MANTSDVNHVDRAGLEAKLTEWGISFDSIEHPEVMTVEEALPHVSHLDGIFAKNLFLRDKKKRNLYLYCAPHTANVKLNDLAKLTSAPGGLRFADEAILTEKLGLRQGSVTVFGLINDSQCEVKLLLDRRLTDSTYSKIYFHPMVNTASTGVTSEGLVNFLQRTGHEPVLVEPGE